MWRKKKAKRMKSTQLEKFMPNSSQSREERIEKTVNHNII